MALSETGQVTYSQVLLFLHRDQESWSTFLSLETKDGYTLTLTPHHLVFLAPHCRHDSREYRPHFASRAKTGDCVLISTAGGQARPSHIISVSVTESVGVYAPLTEAGTLFVDGVLASSYALVEDHRLAHWAFGPLRLLDSLKQLLWEETSNHHKVLTEMQFSTFTTKDKANRNVNNDTLTEQDNHDEPCAIRTQEKNSLERQISDVHWYARFLYRFACFFLDSNLFHP